MNDGSHDMPEHIARQAMGQLISGYGRTQLVYVAAKLGLADLLATGVRSSAELAQSVGADGPTLRRLLRALVAIGVLREGEDGRFGLTPLGEPLREDAPGSLKAAAICAGATFYPAWGDLLESVRTGETAFERVFGVPFFDYFARHPEAGEQFNRYMTGVSTEIGAAVAAAYDFSPFGTLVEVAGGQGTLLAALLKAYPNAKGILFDLAPVIESARPRIEAEGLAERCELVAGDFFDGVPEGGDAYLLKWILHDWDDERAVRLLRSCRRAMGEAARLLVVETVMPERMTAGFTGAVLDIHMLALTGGHERTEAEYRALLAASGFHLSRVIAPPTSAHSPLSGATISVLEGVSLTSARASSA